MESALLIIQSLADFMWNYPMPILLVGTGIYLSMSFRFFYQLKTKFMLQNTYGTIIKKNQKGGEGTVSSFAAACTAMANTVGVGSIGGVATAITMGGPGAIFWLWFSAFFGISTKAAEIILGQRYRVKYKNCRDEYVCDRSFVMKNAMGWKTGGLILALCCFTLGPWTCLVQAEALTSSLKEAFHINPTVSLLVMSVTVGITIVGGLRSMSKILSKVVPAYAMAYILGAIVLVALNIEKVPATFALIFEHAFTPMSGVGGFAGATVMQAIRFGIARGIYSNDAGTGYGMVAHAGAMTDHPIRQSSWGFGEVFLTSVICTLTALTILVTNVYIDFPDITSGQLVTVAYRTVFGEPGSAFLAVAITLFAWATTVGMYYSCEKAVNYFFGDSKSTRIVTYTYMVYYILPILFFSNMQADLLWAATDLLSAIYVLITLTLIYGKKREIFRLFNDFWDRFIPAINRGEIPEPVAFETIESETETCNVKS
ncbi:Amino-acid carrier protein AlsT [Sporomusa rhizae]|uniref:alanine/glycine:cation symporter family protein n=1 Tax=Sporomusa rhizae TaxID=357999 RepID=UPI00352B49E2